MAELMCECGQSHESHVAAVAEAEQKWDAKVGTEMRATWEQGYEQGQTDEREKWIAECELIAKTDDGSATAKRAMEYLLDTLAVIDGEAST